MKNQSHSVDPQFVTTLSTLKKMTDELETLLSKKECQKYNISDIINKFLNNNVKMKENIKAGKLNEVDLASLETSEDLVLPLIPAAPLEHHSFSLIAELKKLISSINKESNSVSGNDVNEIVLLVSIMLLAQNIQN